MKRSLSIEMAKRADDSTRTEITKRTVGQGVLRALILKGFNVTCILCLGKTISPDAKIIHADNTKLMMHISRSYMW